ncbi:hypothetical protein BWU74_18180 [Paraburkholderia caledonica]|nr:hypothetical protein BWU74_18180 [Burkholderia sp. Bk]
MARKSKAQRVHEVLMANPALRREDPRISELIDAEAMLRKAQRLAKNAPLTVASAAGTTKRSPEWINVESSTTMVRRLRQELGIDRLSVKRSEAAGVKVRRSQKAQAIVDSQAYRYSEMADLMPGLAAGWAAYGIVAEDLPEHQQARFKYDLEHSVGVESPEAVRDRFRQHGML